MTSLNGFIKSVAAANRRADRIRQQNARQSQWLYNQRMKETAKQTANETVKNYNTFIESLTAVHKEETEVINWSHVLAESAPVEPVPSNTHESSVTLAIRSYTPSFFDKVFSKTQKKIKKLEEQLLSAKKKDQEMFDTEKAIYKKQKSEWEDMQVIAKGILKKDTTAYSHAVTRMIPFASIPVGKALKIRFEKFYVVVDIEVNTEAIIPKTIYSLTKTGGLSEKKMPTSRFYELYQDHVCSCMLRVATEMTAVLPVEYVVVNAICERLNSSNGRLENQVICSVAFVPANVQKLKLDSLDPSASLLNFIHQMRFSKTTGFQQVELIDPATLVISTPNTPFP